MMPCKTKLQKRRRVSAPHFCSPVNEEDRHYFNKSNMGESATDWPRENRSGDKTMNEQIDHEESTLITKLRMEHHINSYLTQYVLELRSFEIFIVVDDSGSMLTTVDNTDKTRWDELREVVKRILPITMIFDSNGVDIHFLNAGKFPKVKKIEEVEHAFARTPRGYTPLVPVLREIFQSEMAQRGKDKKLLVFVATDGKPTNSDDEDAVNELEFLMRYTRNTKTTHVSFLLCTDDPQCVNYLEGWDAAMENVDVTDDYKTEKEKIRRCQRDDNYHFTYDDYIVKALVGSIVPYIDRLNEKRP